jgi:hypothetical protein
MVANTTVTIFLLYRSRVCVLWVIYFSHKPFSAETKLQLVDVIHILTLSTVLIFYFGIVLTVLHILFFNLLLRNHRRREILQ